MPGFGFHPEALLEYAEATQYYLRAASPQIAEAFVSAVESAVAEILTAPQRWQVIEEPGIRRFVLKKFPFVLYYRWDDAQKRVSVFAVMHCSRKPGYWHGRKG